MNTNLLRGNAGLNRILAFSLAIVWLGAAHVAGAASSAWLLEKAIYTEETKGELQAATEIYRQIVNDPGADRALVAQAQLRLGLCQLKLGNKPLAISALDALTREFPDKDQLLAIVEQQMPQVLNEIVQQIERNYIAEVDRGELIETALRAIVGKLDARGAFLRTNDMEFLSTNELREMNVQLDQKITGVGAVLGADANGIFVQTPMAGSPAQDAGLRAGDRVVAIDGKEVPNMAKAVEWMRGPVGTTVRLGIRRSDWEQAREFIITRNTIRLASVRGDRPRPDGTWEFMLDDAKKIGYIRLSYIGKQSPQEMEDALDDLKARGMKALVFDLRGAPGGMLDGAVAISDLFVESGRIVTVKSRKEETAYDAKAEGTFTGFPIALLVNHHTASAAEIIAAALQDHGRAVVIGERTYGQGIVRSIFQLKSGVGAVKLPIAAYYRPSGKSVNRYPDSKETDDWGVSPDAGYDISVSDEEWRRYLQARNARDLSPEPPKGEIQDWQLQKALEYLQSK